MSKLAGSSTDHVKIAPEEQVIYTPHTSRVQIIAGDDKPCQQTMSEYIYKGDRLTSDLYKGRECRAVRRSDGKCIRGRNGNMLVAFGNERMVVLARQLRKIREIRNKE